MAKKRRPARDLQMVKEDRERERSRKIGIHTTRLKRTIEINSTIQDKTKSVEAARETLMIGYSPYLVNVIHPFLRVHEFINV